MLWSEAVCASASPDQMMVVKRMNMDVCTEQTKEIGSLLTSEMQLSSPYMADKNFFFSQKELLETI